MKIRMNWGAAVTAVYLTFATATMAFVVFALRRTVVFAEGVRDEVADNRARP